MNLARGRVDGDTVALGSFKIPLARERRPAALRDGEVVVGIRPEAFEDVAFAEPGLPTVEVEVEVLEELGADAHVFFRLDAEPVVVEEAQRADGEEDSRALLVETDEALMTARVDPRTSARVGSRLTLAVDPQRLYFFSPESGESLVGQQPVAA
jgi:multiple sugar transport system ATP-binding protein